MMGAADHSADHLVFPLGWRFELDMGRPARLHRLLDTQLRDIKAMLHIRRSDFQIYIATAFDLNHGRLDRVFFHDHLNMLDWPCCLLVLASGKKTGEQNEH